MRKLLAALAIVGGLALSSAVPAKADYYHHHYYRHHHHHHVVVIYHR